MRTVLLEYSELARRLADAHVPTAAERLVDDVDDAVTAAGEIAGPVVMKLISRSIVHKADVGAVILDIRTHDDAVAAAGRLAQVAAEQSVPGGSWQILVQQMVDTARPEIFVGIKRDATFGPILILGAGGSMVELLPEKVIARCPLTVDDAHALLRSTTVGTALGAFRGQPDVTRAVAEVIAAASRLPDVIPALVEADLNPVVVTETGPVAVDARVAVDDGEPTSTGPSARPVSDDGMDALLEPKSILVVGASASGTVQPGNRVLGYLSQHGYRGEVTVAHPTAAEVDGYRAVPDIARLPHGSIDLVCVAVPASRCAEVLEQCGTIGVRAAVVLSSGFSEVGNDGGERELADIAARHGIALCGPNTVGVMTPASAAQVCFSQAQNMASIPQGRVALVVQSGALGGSLASQAWERGIGISHFISVGNQASLTISDYVSHLAETTTTDAIAVVVEGVNDGAAFLDAVAKARAAGKNVIVFKVGRTEVGARAVQSHTGSVAGDYAVYKAVLDGAGAVTVDSITELLDALALTDAKAGLPAGARLGIVSTSGGACSMIADLAAQHGFEVPTFSAELQDRLGGILPGYAAFANPVDVTGRVTADPTIYGKTLAEILGSDEVDAVAVLVTTVADPMAESIAHEVATQIASSTKPALVSWTIAAELAPVGLKVLRDAGIPVFDDPARAVAAARRAGAGGTTG
ncbi:MAG: acetate--CoA ligase family protein [Rhodococcus sp. (in: high G+C Gram-positive bacteria)]